MPAGRMAPIHRTAGIKGSRVPRIPTSSAVTTHRIACHTVGMPDRSSRPKRPRDTSLLAKAIVDETTSEEPPEVEEDTRDEISKAAATLGRRGGLKGGKARAKKLTAERRREIAQKAAEARWKGRDSQTSAS